MDPVLSRRALLRGLAGLGLTAAAGCRNDTPGASSTEPAPRDLGGPTAEVPTSDAWPTVDPASAGWDAPALDAVADFARERATQSLLVVLEGRVLLERHWAGSSFTRDIASAQKSVVSTLAGVAESDGDLDLDASVTSFLGAGWSAAPSAEEARISVRHLLTMTTGLDEGLRRVAEPGEVWSYNNTTYHLVRPVVERATGIGIDDLSRQRLWDPIGASETARWAPRPGGGRYSVDPRGRRFWGLTMGVRDMARFGLLVMRGGMWGTERVLPEAGLARALAPSQSLNPAYGELWWLNGQAAYQLPGRPRRDGPLIPSAPDDLVAALGKDDQKVYAAASLGLVVTRLGDRAGDVAASLSSFDDELWRRLLAAAPGSG